VVSFKFNAFNITYNIPKDLSKVIELENIKRKLSINKDNEKQDYFHIRIKDNKKEFYGIDISRLSLNCSKSIELFTRYFSSDDLQNIIFGVLKKVVYQ
jgi:hypothetical protein